MNMFDNEIRKSKEYSDGADTLRNSLEIEEVPIQPARRNVPTHQPPHYTQSNPGQHNQTTQGSNSGTKSPIHHASQIQPAGTELGNPLTNSGRFKSEWATALASQLTTAAEKVNTTVVKETPTNWFDLAESHPASGKNQGATKVRTAPKISTWFGDEPSEESDSSCDEWDGKIDRIKQNKEKKARSMRKKKHLQGNTATKAAHIIGIGPIKLQSIEYYNTPSVSYHEAKILAVKEYLAHYLKYDEQELSELSIADTKVSANKDDFIYVVMANQDDIRNIYRRKAECQNDDVRLRNFIPPQFHARYMAISRICTERRAQDESLKTLLRFGKLDIEILTKQKGSNEPYYNVDINEFCETDELPNFDPSIKWTFKPDRRPRRSISPTNVSPQLPSLRKNMPTSMIPRLTRQHSTNNSETTQTKKRRTNSDTSSQSTMDTST